MSVNTSSKPTWNGIERLPNAQIHDLSDKETLSFLNNVSASRDPVKVGKFNNVTRFYIAEAGNGGTVSDVQLLLREELISYGIETFKDMGNTYNTSFLIPSDCAGKEILIKLVDNVKTEIAARQCVTIKGVTVTKDNINGYFTNPIRMKDSGEIYLKVKVKSQQTDDGVKFFSTIFNGDTQREDEQGIVTFDEYSQDDIKRKMISKQDDKKRFKNTFTIIRLNCVSVSNGRISVVFELVSSVVKPVQLVSNNKQKIYEAMTKAYKQLKATVQAERSA